MPAAARRPFTRLAPVACLVPLLLLAACRHHQQQPASIDLEEAIAFEARGDYAAAERAATEIVALAYRYAAANDPEMPMLLLFLARQNMNRANFEAAGRNIERAQRLNAAHFAPSDPRSIALTEAEAQLALYVGRAEQSESTMRALIETLREVYGPNHPFVAQALVMIARSLEEQEELEQSAELYEEALGIFRNAWGDRHPDVAGTLLELAFSRALAERTEEAERLAAEALALAGEISRDSEGEERRYAQVQEAILLATRGQMGLRLERPADARADLERALPLLQAGLGPEHPETGWSRVLLGHVLSRLGYFESAEPHLDEGVEAIRRSHGERHPAFMNALLHRSAAYDSAGWYAEAVADYEEAESIRDRLVKLGETL